MRLREQKYKRKVFMIKKTLWVSKCRSQFIIKLKAIEYQKDIFCNLSYYSSY